MDCILIKFLLRMRHSCLLQVASVGSKVFPGLQLMGKPKLSVVSSGRLSGGQRCCENLPCSNYMLLSTSIWWILTAQWLEAGKTDRTWLVSPGGCTRRGWWDVRHSWPEAKSGEVWGSSRFRRSDRQVWQYQRSGPGQPTIRPRACARFRVDQQTLFPI